MAASYPTKILLAFRSGGICAFPGCAKPLVYTAMLGDDTAVGEAAHIKGEKPTAARYEANMTDTERDHVDNLIYMCEGDHTIIDKVPADWPTSKLLALKVAHEAKASAAMAEAFADIAFPELRHAVAWVSSQPPTASVSSFVLLPPEEKIKKNDLSNGSRHTIAAGLSSRTTVADFVRAETQFDPDFPDKLKSGFLTEYYRLRHQGHIGNELFELMCAFSQRGLKSQGDRTAGLAVLIYLFEICDVSVVNSGSEMKRCEFITLLGGAAVVSPIAALAQQNYRIQRIGVLLGTTTEHDLESEARLDWRH